MLVVGPVGKARANTGRQIARQRAVEDVREATGVDILGRCPIAPLPILGQVVASVVGDEQSVVVEEVLQHLARPCVERIEDMHFLLGHDAANRIGRVLSISSVAALDFDNVLHNPQQLVGPVDRPPPSLRPLPVVAQERRRSLEVDDT